MEKGASLWVTCGGIKDASTNLHSCFASQQTLVTINKS